jgi:acyl-CoA synthetase (AMP-forming)/AMP-acid ligase II
MDRLPSWATLPLRRKGLPSLLADLPATIPQLLAARASEPDADFLIGKDFRLTFGEADEQSTCLAAQLLAAGVGKGTRLGLLFPNDAQWVITWLAAARIGALSVPLSTFSPGPELASAIRHADVHALLTAPTFADHDLVGRLEDAMEPLAQSSPRLEMIDWPYLRWIHVHGDAPPPWSNPLSDAVSESVVLGAQQEVVPADPLVIISTSGITAAPKAVVHTHGSLVRHGALLAQHRGFTPVDRIYSPMPFFWVGGLTMVLLASLSSGAGAVVQERFDAGDALLLAERERVTQVSCWPNAARAMAKHPTFASRDLSSVRGGTLVEALPPDQRPPSPDRAPMPLGMTETGGPHTAPRDPYAPLPEDLRGTFGSTLAGIEHRVVDIESGARLSPGSGDEGELLVRGPFVMEGLYKRERHDTFSPAGWYATGDLGWFDAEGQLYFSGRRASMIKSGGANVAPIEVEAVLASLSGVRAAFVFGVPAGDRGEDVAAVVAVAPGTQVDEDTLTSSAREMLSNFKVPRHYRIIEEPDLPVLPTGKVNIAALRSLFAEDDM